MTTLPLALVALCVLAESFFSGSEMALLNANRIELRKQAEEGSAGARRVLALLNQPDRMLGTCLIGANLCLVTAATVFTWLVVSLARQGFTGSIDPSLLAAAALAPIVMVFGELAPKTVYQHHADRLAPIVVWPLAFFSRLFWPGLVLMEGTAALISAFTNTGGGSAEPMVSRDELRLLVEAKEEGGIDKEDRQLIRNALLFADITVKEAMVPLVEVVGMPQEATVAEAASRMVATGFSRLPVYRDRVDDIVGVVLHWDLLFAESSQATLGSCTRKVPYVPESKPVGELLEELRRDRQRLAVAVDEYGGATGIITTEDILEELVGEIEDEFDQRPMVIHKLGDGRWKVSGRTERGHLEEAVGLILPDGDFETVAGFLLAHLGHIPQPGELVTWGDWRLEVAKANDRAIQEIVLSKPSPARELGTRTVS